MKTKADNRQWILIDLKDKVLGRVATRMADILRGKHKPGFTPNMDLGDFIVAINAGKLKLTGNKMDDKIYYKHTGYMGGLKSIVAKKLLDKDPERVIKDAVKGMLPRNILSRQLINKLKVYAGSEHPHSAQKPQELKV